MGILSESMWVYWGGRQRICYGRKIYAGPRLGLKIGKDNCSANIQYKINIFRIQYKRRQQLIHYIKTCILKLVLSIILEISVEAWFDVVSKIDIRVFVRAVCARYQSVVVRDNKERYGLSQLMHICWWRHHAMFLYAEKNEWT